MSTLYACHKYTVYRACIILLCLCVKEIDSLTAVSTPSFKLQVGVTMIGSGWVNAVFIRNDFPELGTDLVAALSSLNVHELTHGCCCKREERSQTDCFEDSWRAQTGKAQRVSCCCSTFSDCFNEQANKETHKQTSVVRLLYSNQKLKQNPSQSWARIFVHL